MEYSIMTLLQGLAEVLDEFGYPIYISQRQQGVTTPCFFLTIMLGDSRKELGATYFNDLSVDIVFLQDPNIINATEGIIGVIEYLDEHLELVPYRYDPEEDPEWVHTYDRSHQIQDFDLHYHVTFRNRVYLPENETLMKTLEAIDYEIKVKRQ